MLEMSFRLTIIERGPPWGLSWGPHGDRKGTVGDRVIFGKYAC